MFLLSLTWMVIVLLINISFLVYQIVAVAACASKKQRYYFSPSIRLLSVCNDEIWVRFMPLIGIIGLQEKREELKIIVHSTLCSNICHEINDRSECLLTEWTQKGPHSLFVQQLPNYWWDVAQWSHFFVICLNKVLKWWHNDTKQPQHLF
jgi:hypothetical protein